MWKAEELVVFGEHLLMFSKAKQKQKYRNPIQMATTRSIPHTHPSPSSTPPAPNSAKPGLFCRSPLSIFGVESRVLVYTLL
jgi:hypothetical protein